MTGIYRPSWPHHPRGIHMVRGVNLHDVIKLDTLAPWSQPTLDLMLIPPTMFIVCFYRLIVCVLGAGPWEAGERRICSVQRHGIVCRKIMIIDSGYWWWKVVGLDFVNSCVINTPEAGGWTGFKRHLGFQCFFAPRQISLHGGFILYSYVLTTWLRAENASPSYPALRWICATFADLCLSQYTCTSLRHRLDANWVLD